MIKKINRKNGKIDREVIMWKIKHIFDGNYGCEEAAEEQTGKLSLTLINENGEERYVSVTDAWLTERGLDEDSIWPERFHFRDVRREDTEEVTEIEQICFPPNEACSARSMKARIEAAPELFLVAEDIETGRIAGFLNGLSTKETIFRDEFFTDITLHNRKGKNIMLLGLDVLPEYRGQGLASEIMERYLKREQEIGRKRVVLTCLDEKVKMYEKMGYKDLGISGSVWGGEKWHDMEYVL